jgi:hypothetical protein
LGKAANTASRIRIAVRRDTPNRCSMSVSVRPPRAACISSASWINLSARA